jgi:diphthamide synthase subunit DPH2
MYQTDVLSRTLKNRNHNVLKCRQIMSFSQRRISGERVKYPYGLCQRREAALIATGEQSTKFHQHHLKTNLAKPLFWGYPSG